MILGQLDGPGNQADRVFAALKHALQALLPTLFSPTTATSPLGLDLKPPAFAAETLGFGPPLAFCLRWTPTPTDHTVEFG
jgi:hypothetical protein